MVEVGNNLARSDFAHRLGRIVGGGRTVYRVLSLRRYMMATMPRASSSQRISTQTSSFGVSRRENHDSSPFYARFSPPLVNRDEHLGRRPRREGPILGDARSMSDLPSNSVALMVTSPPYFVGKEYENEVMGAARSGNVLSEVPGSYMEYLQLLHDVFQECYRVLEPGGRMAVNVANLGRKPYRSLSADVIRIFGDLGLFLRGEIIWRKAAASSGSCAWGSFRSPSNPVLRDVTERVVVASKGRFDRALPPARRQTLGLPHVATTNSDEFMESHFGRVGQFLRRTPAEWVTQRRFPLSYPYDSSICTPTRMTWC